MSGDALELAREVVEVEQGHFKVLPDAIVLARALLSAHEELERMRERLRVSEQMVVELGSDNVVLERVYGHAASMRVHPVPFDQFWELIGLVDEARLVLSPEHDDDYMGIDTARAKGEP